MYLSEEGARKLAAGIVIQAIKDYKRAIRDPKVSYWKPMLKRFFRSSWCEELCGEFVDYAALIKEMERDFGC